MERPAGRPYWDSRQKATVAQTGVLAVETGRRGWVPHIFRRQDLNLEMREGKSWVDGGAVD